jgi:hypothetical protein
MRNFFPQEIFCTHVFYASYAFPLRFYDLSVLVDFLHGVLPILRVYQMIR